MAEGTGIPRNEADDLVVLERGWAESIARSVARAWNLDWQQDGLDGAAMEALIFCARRFDPARGVPFRGYARRRIHEASTDAARRTKNWRNGVAACTRSESVPNSVVQGQARQLSADLLTIFPDLRSGELPLVESGEGGGGDDGDEVRGAIRQLIVGASILAARQGENSDQPDDLLDLKRMVTHLTGLEPIHQMIMYKLYWEGFSMRSVADEWKTDELNIIREHKVLLAFLSKCLAKGKSLAPPKVRPGLKDIAARLKNDLGPGQFLELVRRGTR